MTSTPSTTERARETAGTAQQEGAALAQSTAEAGGDLARTASDQASHVAGHAAAEAQNLLGTARTEVSDQVDAQRRRLVDVLRTTGDELGSAGESHSALTAELTRRTSEQARRFADYLDNHGPDDVLNDVRRFARRRPGTFLLLAGLAGVAAGRIFRGVSAASSDQNDSSRTLTGGGSAGTPVPVSESAGTTTYQSGAAAGSEYSGLGVGARETIPQVPAAAPTYSAPSTYATPGEVLPPAGALPTDEVYPPVPGSTIPPATGGTGYAPVDEPYAPVDEPYAPAGTYPTPPTTPGVPPVPPVPGEPDPYVEDPYGQERRSDERGGLQ